MICPADCPSETRVDAGPGRKAGTARRRRGFTLVEIMVAVVIIGLLAAMAVPAFQRVRERSQATRMVNDLRQYADAYQRYALENGAWPPVGGVASAPAGMEAYLPATYENPTPFGGGYTWSGNSARLRLADSAATDALMQRVDALLDDGNLATGDFRKSGGGYELQLH